MSLFWCGNVGNAAPLTRRQHRIHVSWRLECPRCGVPKLAEVDPGRYGDPCPHRDPWLTDIPVTDVRSDALDLLHLEGRSEGTSDEGSASHRAESASPRALTGEADEPDL